MNSPSLTSENVLQQVKKKLSRKIRSFEQHLDRCLKVQEALTRTINEQLDLVSYKGQDPKELLRLLLAAAF